MRHFIVFKMQSIITLSSVDIERLALQTKVSNAETPDLSVSLLSL